MKNTRTQTTNMCKSQYSLSLHPSVNLSNFSKFPDVVVAISQPLSGYRPTA